MDFRYETNPVSIFKDLHELLDEHKNELCLFTGANPPGNFMKYQYMSILVLYLTALVIIEDEIGIFYICIYI